GAPTPRRPAGGTIHPGAAGERPRRRIPRRRAFLHAHRPDHLHHEAQDRSGPAVLSAGGRNSASELGSLSGSGVLAGKRSDVDAHRGEKVHSDVGEVPLERLLDLEQLLRLEVIPEVALLTGTNLPGAA